MKTDEEYMKLIKYVEYDGDYGMCNWREHKEKWNDSCYLKKGIHYWQTEGIYYALLKWWGDSKPFPEWIKVCEKCAPTIEKALEIYKQMGRNGYNMEYGEWWGNDFVDRNKYDKKIEKRNGKRRKIFHKYGLGEPGFYPGLAK